MKSRKTQLLNTRRTHEVYYNISYQLSCVELGKDKNVEIVKPTNKWFGESSHGTGYTNVYLVTECSTTRLLWLAVRRAIKSHRKES